MAALDFLWKNGLKARKKHWKSWFFEKPNTLTCVYRNPNVLVEIELIIKNILTSWRHFGSIVLFEVAQVRCENWLKNENLMIRGQYYSRQNVSWKIFAQLLRFAQSSKKLIKFRKSIRNQNIIDFCIFIPENWYFCSKKSEKVT